MVAGSGGRASTPNRKLRETCTHAELNGDWGLGDEGSRRLNNNTGRVRYISSKTKAAGSGDCSSHLGQCQLIPELLQMRGHDRPSEGGVWPLWRTEFDLESDGDSC
jgi:hypothetical protein